MNDRELSAPQVSLLNLCRRRPISSEGDFNARTVRALAAAGLLQIVQVDGAAFLQITRAGITALRDHNIRIDRRAARRRRAVQLLLLPEAELRGGFFNA